MRRKTAWLMAGDKPEGGRWNYDAKDRKKLPRNFPIPPGRRFVADATTHDVMTLVRKRFADYFGSLESFGWAVTREDALEPPQHFITNLLPRFGDYQDAMKAGQDFLFHSVLPPYINIGLLSPREVCKAILAAYHQGSAPLSAVEGFVRKILGWREYVRGVYWMKMPDYAQTNFLNAERPLPGFYWTGETDMKCLREVIEATRRNAYAHHIQRLMITSNFALLAGVVPAQVEEWYLSVYADVFEQVEMPNTHGMAQHADGCLLGSKPNAGSGAYIHRMSDYCAGCAYEPEAQLGTKACPFNCLYWYCSVVKEARLKPNPPITLPYGSLARMTAKRRQQSTQQAEQLLARLES